VKPANVLLRKIEGGRLQAVFVDLGVSRMVRDEEPHDECLTEITRADRSVGTYEYMAPEQVLSCRDVAPSADLYAVGSILYRAVSGHHPFGELHGGELLKRKLSGQAPALQTGRSDRVALAFEALVARALAMSPDERYESADEMLTELSHLRDSARRAAREARSRATIPPPSLSSVPPSLVPPSHASLPRASVPAPPRSRGVRLTVALALAVAGIGVGLAAGTALEARTLRSSSALRIDDRACSLVPMAAAEQAGRTAYAIVCGDKTAAR
jgi:serine/threonine-protein kinase